MKMENGISTDILQTSSHQETKPKPAQEDEFATLGAFLASLSEAIPKNQQSSPKKEAISSSDHSPSLEVKDQRPSPSKLAPKKRFASFEPDNNHVSLMEKLITPKLAQKDEKSSDYETSLLHDERTAQTIKNEIDALQAENGAEPMSLDKPSENNQPDDPNMAHKRKGLNDDDWRPGHGIMKKKQKKMIKKKIKPTSRREIGDEKLSFQEAAVQVLEEQREKGIQALSTRRIWELISQSGLVDTKCKTPVSSLSSRITEDVRTKGNKSVFVRVGEGLYTLRKGLKKQDLEKFLSTKYPNLAHAKIDYDKFSDDGSGDEPEAEDSNTEESQEKEVKNEKEVFSSPESSPPMKESPPPPVTNYTHHIQTRERDNEVLNSIPSWTGLPLKTKRSGDIYYTAVKVNKFKFRIGDCAYFTPNAEDSQPYVGQITRLWQSPGPDYQMLVQCVWYYHPEDTHSGRTKKNHKQELFLSDLSDVNNVNSLLSPVEVLSYPEFSKRIAQPNLTKKELKDIFFCRTFYDENNHIFYNLEADDNGSIRIEGLKPASDSVSTVRHWPANVQYTPTLLWRDLSEQVKDLLNSKANALVEIRPIQTEVSAVDLNGTDEENSGEADCSLFAATDIPDPTTLGEYTGYLINNTAGMQEDPESVKTNKYTRTLYEDHEVLVHVDATHAGNEFRMMKDSSQTNRKPNARFQSTRVEGKWHLFVVSTCPIKKGEEILADYTVNYYSSLREEEEAFDNEEHREDEFDQPSLPSENPGSK